MDLRQLITLKKQGVSNRKAAQMLHLSRNTVNEYTQILDGLQRCDDGLLALEESVLRELLVRQSEVSREQYE